MVAGQVETYAKSCATASGGTATFTTTTGSASGQCVIDIPYSVISGTTTPIVTLTPMGAASVASFSVTADGTNQQWVVTYSMSADVSVNFMVSDPTA